LNLRGIKYCVFVASGTLNFFGEGWWFHKIFRRIFPAGFDFSGATFVSKTTTLYPRKGNMALDENLHPLHLFPECIRVYPVKGVILNSVGLSGPGAWYLLLRRIWQKMKKPFFISFMAVGEDRRRRLHEVEQFCDLLEIELPMFYSRVGVELNISCPNTQLNPTDLVEEAIYQLKPFSGLGIPIILKLNVLTPIEAALKISDSGLCDAISVSNTIPFGQLPEKIDWKGIFGSVESPLKHLGGGGLSGYPLLPVVSNWILRANREGISVPIIGGGGILEEEDVDYLYTAGADAVSIGSVAILRPWRVNKIIKRAKKIYGGDQQ